MTRWHVSFAVLVAACGGSERTPEPDAAPIPSIAGVWQVESGPLFDISFGLGTDSASVDFIELVPANDGARTGSGTLFASVPAGLHDCAPLVYSELGVDGVTFSIPGVALPDVHIVEHIDGDHIAISDAFGTRTELVRTEAIPEASQCKSATVATEIPLPVPVASFSGLASDGTLLWYEGIDQTWIPFDPATGGFGPAIAIPTAVGQFTHIQAFQAGELWAHCGCGGSETAERIVPGTGATTATIDTESLLGASGIGIRGIAFDGTNVLLAGRNFDNNMPQVLVIDVAADPVLLDTLSASVTMRTLGLRGDELWVLSSAFGQALARLDPDSGEILDSIKLPAGPNISAFAFAGTTLYALGSNSANKDVILELTID